ncbi:hypothetical protein BCR42DRAFT_420541 [Absidia repens]|uniref:F-box domain-containing protein n=1 Tax=Absidia repens TaxID=90262 RepID=A0A1X2IBC4_9FUNG|nr:hypothetical protein BCR42DRAFT_420541 [Absidia repens]
MDHRVDLPTEIVSLILENVNQKDLYACSLVNHQFHAVANPLLWCSFGIKSAANFQRVMTGLRESNPPMGRYVRHVHLTGFVTDMQLMAFMLHTPLLEDLLMEDGRRLTNISLCRLPGCCPRLKLMLLRGSDITHRSIQVLANACHGLRILHLDECLRLSSTIFATLAAGCPMLNELTIDVGGMKEFDIYAHALIATNEHARARVYGIARAAAMDLAGLRVLTQLTVRNSPAPFSQHLLVTSDRQGRVAWPYMIDFRLLGCYEVTDNHAITFIKEHPTLVGLALEEGDLSDVVLRAISLSLPLIVYVGLSFNGRITGHALRHVILDCEWLQYLRLVGCGIPASEFPEASPECVDMVNGFLPLLDHLDSDAIEEIKLIGFRHDNLDDAQLDDADEDDDHLDNEDDLWIDVYDTDDGTAAMIDQFQQLALFGNLLHDVIVDIRGNDDEEDSMDDL